MQIGPLFIGVQPTNEPHRVVLACWTPRGHFWRWAIYRSAWRSWRFHFGGTFGEQRHFTPGGHGNVRDSLGAVLCIPLLGSFMFSQQPRYPST